MKAIVRAFLFGLLCMIVLFPEPIEAGSHGPVISHYAPYRLPLLGFLNTQ